MSTTGIIYEPARPEAFVRERLRDAVGGSPAWTCRVRGPQQLFDLRVPLPAVERAIVCLDVDGDYVREHAVQWNRALRAVCAEAVFYVYSNGSLDRVWDSSDVMPADSVREIIRGGSLRDMEALLRTRGDELDTKTRGWLENILRRAPPRAAPPGSTRDRSRELRWLRDHSLEHRGQWVAVEGDDLIATGGSLDEVLAVCREKSISDPLFTFVPESSGYAV